MITLENKIIIIVLICYYYHDHQPHSTIVRLLVRAEEQAVVQPGLLARVHIVEWALKHEMGSF